MSPHGLSAYGFPCAWRNFFLLVIDREREREEDRHIDGNHILQPEEGGKEKKVFYKDLVFPLPVRVIHGTTAAFSLMSPICTIPFVLPPPLPLKQNLPPKTPPAFYVYLTFLSSRCAVNQGFRDTH